jgi:biotin synthase
MRGLIDKLSRDNILSRAEFVCLIGGYSSNDAAYASRLALEAREAVYGRSIYMRGLIEFSNYCKNDCYYCGIRRSNMVCDRYRLTKEEIIECCENGYALGFRTFVLQSGEDNHYTDEIMVDIIREIHRLFPDCAITLSLGERSRVSYKRMFESGARRYLLRHESANYAHYAGLHPVGMRLSSRMKCLRDLQEIGYQVGCGFMVGSPGQDAGCLADDLLFVAKFKPHMVGIGPFIPHRDTPFGGDAAGSIDLTLFLISLLRLIDPQLLLPATTALGTLDSEGRERGVLAGANVVMPNLSPVRVRGKYLLYDGKICTGDEAAECRSCMEMRMRFVGHELVVDRGDYKEFKGVF